ncbi:hypothetical protein SAMN04488107_4542 [Geodermatophilus saharensis]|uniref:Uncharacterized protein n=1 Tax=Geodermatophilus saharensis TaxID=1137994 RepID=A0A239IYI9_9ACTN|nr:hypothetical protein [Geodermatophilus saharensis]SNS98595.1 hypothetical protein SAMN04488107_4542 [Geodermatophilus saharensis]
MPSARPLDLLAAPSSAAAHWPGQERAWAALQRAGLPGALAAGGVDLRTPADNPTGVADSMALAHVLALDGCDPDLLAVGPVPLLPVGRVRAVGVRATEPDATTAARTGPAVVGAAEVAADPAGVAADAVAAVGGPAGSSSTRRRHRARPRPRRRPRRGPAAGRRARPRAGVTARPCRVGRGS